MIQCIFYIFTIQQNTISKQKQPGLTTIKCMSGFVAPVLHLKGTCPDMYRHQEVLNSSVKVMKFIILAVETTYALLNYHGNRKSTNSQSCYLLKMRDFLPTLLVFCWET